MPDPQTTVDITHLKRLTQNVLCLIKTLKKEKKIDTFVRELCSLCCRKYIR